MSTTIIYGKYRKSKYEEVGQFGMRSCNKLKYTYIVTQPYTFTKGEFNVTVPRGFICDGASAGPQVGIGWLFHDYLYAEHKFTSGQHCSREQADQVVIDCANINDIQIYGTIFGALAKWNPFNAFNNPYRFGGGGAHIVPVIGDVDDQ